MLLTLFLSEASSYALVLVVLVLLLFIVPLILAVIVLRWAWKQWHESAAGDQRRALVVVTVTLLAALGYTAWVVRPILF
jgi:hypothetical protein